MGPRQFSAGIGHSFRVARRVETQSAGSENDGGLCSASKRAAELTESRGFWEAIWRYTKFGCRKSRSEWPKARNKACSTNFGNGRCRLEPPFFLKQVCQIAPHLIIDPDCHTAPPSVALPFLSPRGLTMTFDMFESRSTE